MAAGALISLAYKCNQRTGGSDRKLLGNKESSSDRYPIDRLLSLQRQIVSLPHRPSLRTVEAHQNLAPARQPLEKLWVYSAAHPGVQRGFARGSILLVGSAVPASAAEAQRLRPAAQFDGSPATVALAVCGGVAEDVSAVEIFHHTVIFGVKTGNVVGEVRFAPRQIR